MKSLLVSDMFVLFNVDYISNIRYGNRLSLGLSGAILMDLAVYKKIEIKGNKVLLIDTSNTEDNFLNGGIEVLSSLKKKRKIKYYLTNFLHTGVTLFPLFIDRLEKIELMKISFSERNIFGKSFMYFSVTNINNDIREDIIIKLKKVILENGPVPDKPFWYLISLLRATNGYSHFFGKEYRSQVKSIVKKLIIDEPIGKRVRLEIRSAESTDSGTSD